MEQLTQGNKLRRGIVLSAGSRDVGIFIVPEKEWWALRDILLKAEFTKRQQAGHLMLAVQTFRNFELLRIADISNIPWARFEIVGLLVIPANFECFSLRPEIGVQVRYAAGKQMLLEASSYPAEGARTMEQDYSDPGDPQEDACSS